MSTVVSFRRGKVVREFARTDRTQAGSFLHSLLEICDASLFVGEDDSFRLSSSLHNILHNVVLYPICAWFSAQIAFSTVSKKTHHMTRSIVVDITDKSRACILLSGGLGC